MNKHLTIVIPCKNEGKGIIDVVKLLLEQTDCKIIIADSSDDEGSVLLLRKYASIYPNIQIVEGGLPSIARNNGAKLVTTPYILFIDSDVRFFSDAVINDCVQEMENKQLDLIGLKIKCYDKNKRTQIGFILFNMINNIMKYKVPFAVGAFMLTRTDKFNEFGGFSEKYQTSEDFFLSKKYDVKKFKLMHHYFGQDSRRFEIMGYTGMAWYLIKNFWNRNNKEYWDSLDYSKYWK